MVGGPRAERRADYASTRERVRGAWIAHVADGSPAWEAGLEAGMRIDAVNGQELPTSSRGAGKRTVRWQSWQSLTRRTARSTPAS